MAWYVYVGSDIDAWVFFIQVKLKIRFSSCICLCFTGISFQIYFQSVWIYQHDRKPALYVITDTFRVITVLLFVSVTCQLFSMDH